MWLAAGNLYLPRFSEQIHEEWTRNVLQDYPDLSAAKLARTRALMNRVVPDALVTGYESRIDSLMLPDAGDRHVLAAAIESRASVIVTFNLKHFPIARLAPHGISAISPDSFALALYTAAPDDFLRAVQVHRANLTRPPKTVDEYLAALAHTRFPNQRSP